MHTIWKGSISFGLVNIPINLYAATDNKDVKFRSLHKECHNPIKYEKMCPICEKEVEYNDIVKGYEYEPGKFIVIEKEELNNLTPESNKMIEIIDFVKLEEIDPIYFEKSYFLGPRENGLKSYSLLKQAMEETGKIGVAKITIRTKESYATVRAYAKGLVLDTIFYPEEVRNFDMVPGITDEVQINDKELTMAKQLIEQLTAPFEPSALENTYRNDIIALIESKAKGKEFKIVEEAPKTNVVDLMQALQASIDRTKPEKQKEAPKKKRAPKKKKAE